MNKKGFTLIELLAVIVILAVIALITTPMIMDVINEARRGSLERTYENIEHAAELYFFDKNEGKLEEDPMTIPMSELKSMVKNYTSDMESESVIVSKKVKDIDFYYTGRDNNPYEVQGKLKELIEKGTNHIKMNVVVNGKTVNKVYGTKSEKDSVMKNYVWYSGNYAYAESENIGYYLNNADNSYYSWLSDEVKSYIVDYEWQLPVTAHGSDYSLMYGYTTDGSYPSRKSDGAVTAKVGLPSYGDRYSGNDLNISYWYINRWTGSSSLVGRVNSGGHAGSTATGSSWHAVRPVMVLNSNVVITEGNVTMNNPYSIKG